MSSHVYPNMHLLFHVDFYLYVCGYMKQFFNFLPIQTLLFKEQFSLLHEDPPDYCSYYWFPSPLKPFNIYRLKNSGNPKLSSHYSMLHYGFASTIELQVINLVQLL